MPTPPCDRTIAGSQYTQLIARRIRELGMFSVLFPGDASLVRFSLRDDVIQKPRSLPIPPPFLHSSRAAFPPQERIKGSNPRVVILSGGPNSVHVEGSPRTPPGFFEYCEEQSIPVLGICYGMQVGAPYAAHACSLEWRSRGGGSICATGAQIDCPCS